MSPELLLDFRSDTRTTPDTAMRAAMAGAAVGDDAYGDDPSVLELEAAGARLTGKQAALFLPSGTMANLVAVLCAAPGPGAALLTGADTHVARLESEGIRRFGGVRLVPVAQRDDGSLRPTALERALREHAPDGAVVGLENTCMLHSGNALDAAALDEAAAPARRHGAHVHLDGARLANAAVAHGVPVAHLAAAADSVTVCLSKGLGAPVGSLLCGTTAFVARARTARLHLGGTMHQAGVVAAAGLRALERVPHLADDHALTARLAAGLAMVPGAEVARPPHPTNIVTLRMRGLTDEELTGQLAAAGVRVLPLGDGRVRFVVHREHSTEAVPEVVGALTAAGPVSVPRQRRGSGHHHAQPAPPCPSG